MEKVKYIILTLLLSSTAMGYEREGVSFRDSIKLSDGGSIPIFSAGLLRYKIIFKGYVLALYLEDPKKDPLEDQSRQLTFYYFWDIDSKAFADAATKHLKQQLGGKKFALLKPKIEEFHKLYVNIKEGDRYHLRYEPNTGTQLYYNRKLLGTVKGKEFAKAYFGIWLGKNPISESLKKQLGKQIRGKK